MAGSSTDTRASLIQAVTTLLFRSGVSAISVKQVAAEAGVNHGLVHYHFGSKEGLVVAAYAAYRERQRAQLDAMDASDPDRLRQHLAQEIGLAGGLMVEFAALSMHMPTLRAAIEAGLADVVDVVTHKLGLPHPRDGDVWIAHFFGIAVHSRLRSDFDVDHAVRLLLDLPP